MTQGNLRILKSFALAYAAAVISSALTMTSIFAGMALLMADLKGPEDFLLGTLGLLLALAIGASLFAFPAMIVGFPIALHIARRASRRRTVLCGALSAPLVATAAQTGFFYYDEGSLQPGWLSAVLPLLPAQISAGAAVGWTVSWREQRR